MSSRSGVLSKDLKEVLRVYLGRERPEKRGESEKDSRAGRCLARSRAGEEVHVPGAEGSKKMIGCEVRAVMGQIPGIEPWEAL